jgi:hypothetical protein
LPTLAGAEGVYGALVKLVGKGKNVAKRDLSCRFSENIPGTAVGSLDWSRMEPRSVSGVSQNLSLCGM